MLLLSSKSIPPPLIRPLESEFRNATARYDLFAHKMDPITAIATVAKIALAIKTWVDDKSEKDEAIIEVGETVGRLSNILDHLSMKANYGEIDLVVTPQILSLGSVLTKTLQDIRIWTPRTLGLKKILATLVPRKVIEVIREDERKIMQQLVILMFALSTTSNHPAGSGRSEDNSKPNALKWIRNPEVADFWGTYVGRHVLNPSLYQLTMRYFMFRQPISSLPCNAGIRNNWKSQS